MRYEFRVLVCESRDINNEIIIESETSAKGEKSGLGVKRSVSRSTLEKQKEIKSEKGTRFESKRRKIANI